MKNSCILLIFIVFSMVGHAQQIAIEPLKRVGPNGQWCDGYSATIEFDQKTVIKYMKESLDAYGKNLQKKHYFLYEDVSAEGLQWPAVLMADVEEIDKSKSKVWLGLMRGGESFPQAEKILYDALYHLYTSELSKKEKIAENAYNKAVDRRERLGKDYVANEEAFNRINQQIADAMNEQDALKQQQAAQELEVAKLRASLDEMAKTHADSETLEQAHKDYEKALALQQGLAKKLASNAKQQVSLEGKLQQNRLDKTHLEEEIVRNKEEISSLKERWEILKASRAHIK